MPHPQAALVGAAFFSLAAALVARRRWSSRRRAEGSLRDGESREPRDPCDHDAAHTSCSASLLDPQYIPRLLDAVTFAAEKHSKQRRKNSDQDPYINHCLGVVHILARVGRVADLHVLQAGVLHDTYVHTRSISRGFC